MVLSTDCPSDTIIEVRHTMLNISILFISLFFPKIGYLLQKTKFCRRKLLKPSNQNTIRQKQNFRIFSLSLLQIKEYATTNHTHYRSFFRIWKDHCANVIRTRSYRLRYEPETFREYR